MSIYANIKFNMKDGYPEPNRHYDSQCGEFRDAVLELINIYDEKHGINRLSRTVTLSGEELAEFGKHYADEVEVDKICFQIKNFEFDDTEEKNILVCEYFKNGEFTIEDDEIFSYECYESPAFMPVYNRHKIWACLDREFDEEVFNKNIAIFKRYVQLTLEGKMFFGVQISKIESVTLELC